VDKFGGAHQVQNLPDGLKIQQVGKDLGHFEMVPAKSGTLTPAQFQELLKQVQLN
jgi:hypothetical protein